MMNCSWASAPPSARCPLASGCPSTPCRRRAARPPRPGGGGWSSWRRNTDTVCRCLLGRGRSGAGRYGGTRQREAGRTRRSRCRPSSRAEMARRSRIGSSGLTTQPSAPDRRAMNTSGRRSSSISTGTCAELAVGGLEPELETDGHAAHVAHLQVDDHQIGERLGHLGHDRRAGAGLPDGDVRPTGDGGDLGPDRGGIAGHEDGAHGQRLALLGRSTHGRGRRDPSARRSVPTPPPLRWHRPRTGGRRWCPVRRGRGRRC